MAVMKVFIDVKREGAWWVATDLFSGVADQGKTEAAAIKALETALRERVALLSKLAPQKKNTRIREIEV